MRLKLFSVFTMFIFAGGIAISAMPPWPSYCEHQNYTYFPENNTCRFSKNRSCNAMSFYNGTCGQEFVREIPCREKEDLVFPEFENCCKGLEPYLPPMTVGHSTCRPKPGFIGSLNRFLEHSMDFIFALF